MSSATAVMTAQSNVAVLAKCVVPLFALTHERELLLGGTGVLVQVANGPAFLFTAGHVLDEFARSSMFVWPQDGQPVKITGEGFTSEPQHVGRSGDPVDLAVLRIAQETARSLSTAGFLFADSSCMSATVPDRGVCAIIGYPHAANRPDIERTLEGKKVTTLYADPKVIFATACTQPDYDRARRSRLLNIILERQRRWTKGNDGHADPRHGLKSPSGMSGGAMFSLGNEDELELGQCSPQLAGIFTRYVDKRRFMIGANARAMAELVRRDVRIGV
ncbi:MAG TPA: hypothetical protein VGQ36_02395 [Thermoanaerobaculia bacterium]|jgi:hypothetical protein|nr:hypothetical protein [Thermoanaerobaculia bacterium]